MAGTRPEAIKLSSIKVALGDEAEVLHTGQHTQIFEEALLPITHRLQWHGIGTLSFNMRPYDIVIVEGDTYSTFNGALTAFLQGVPVAHVEAGLRTLNKFRPFPEEMLRRLVSEIADVHFAPTARAAENLVGRENVHIVGNPVVDAAINAATRTYFGPEYALATVHRRESWGEPLKAIIAALEALPIDVKLVVHPSVERDVRQMVRFTQILEPQTYAEMMTLVANATVLLTDSGGLQEEAPIFGTPVVVMREETERVEGIEAGVAILGGTSRDGIIAAAEKAMRMPRVPCSIYGDGRAGERIVKVLREYLA